MALPSEARSKLAWKFSLTPWFYFHISITHSLKYKTMSNGSPLVLLLIKLNNYWNGNIGYSGNISHEL